MGIDRRPSLEGYGEMKSELKKGRGNEDRKFGIEQSQLKAAVEDAIRASKDNITCKEEKIGEDEKLGKKETIQKTVIDIIKYLTVIANIWLVILNRDFFKRVAKKLFTKPVYLCFFAFSLSFLLGNLEFNILWCLGVALLCNFLAYRIYKLLEIESHQLGDSIIEDFDPKYPDKESAVWINNIIKSIFNNHSQFISQICIQILNPVFVDLFSIPPIEQIKFTSLSLGNKPPRISNCSVLPDAKHENLKFDFNAVFRSELKGKLEIKFQYIPKPLSVDISDLFFKGRLRFDVTMKKEGAPFVNTLQISMLEKPEIDISVEILGFPDILLAPLITEHYVDFVRDFLFNEFGSPKFIEIDFSKFIVDEGDAGLGFVEHVLDTLPQAISHVNQVDSNKILSIGRAVKLALTPLKTIRPSMDKKSKEKEKKVGGSHRRSRSSDTDIQIPDELLFSLDKEVASKSVSDEPMLGIIKSELESIAANRLQSKSTTPAPQEKLIKFVGRNAITPSVGRSAVPSVVRNAITPSVGRNAITPSVGGNAAINPSVSGSAIPTVGPSVKFMPQRRVRKSSLSVDEQSLLKMVNETPLF